MQSRTGRKDRGQNSSLVSKWGTVGDCPFKCSLPSLTQNLSFGIQNNFATVDTGLLYVLLVWEQQQIKKKYYRVK